jgi:fatty acid elongase 3
MSAIFNQFISHITSKPSEYVASDRIPSWSEPAIGSLLYLSLLYFLLRGRDSKTSSDKTSRSRVLLYSNVIHNVVLVLLSLSMFCGGVYSYTMTTTNYSSFCDSRSSDSTWNGVSGWWMHVFYWSKYYELLDTVFLVLNGKNIIFLHVYHHVSMLYVTCAWLRFGWREGSQWCIVVNSLIHVFMYTYYLLSLLNIRVSWKRYMTQGQLVQFVTGLFYVGVYAYLHLFKGGCGLNEHGILGSPRFQTAMASTFVNITFIILFSQFYRRAYNKKKNRKNV